MKTNSQIKNLNKGTKKEAISVFFFIFFLFINISSINAQLARVSVSLKQAPLKLLIKSIENQTPYKFSFRDSEISLKKVTLNVQNKTVKSVLNQSLGNELSYVFKDNTIVIRPKPHQSKSIRMIKGSVNDSAGNPIIGATVIVKGNSTNGTITDIDGNFSLNVPMNSTLRVSYVGYVSKDVMAKFGKPLSIMIEEDSKLIDEVVVIGYGTVKKKDLTGAVGTVKSKDLVARKTTQLTNALQGAVSGVMITRNDNSPGASGSIKVRGVTTMSDSAPLVIIDGVPGNLDDVSSNDVENLSILKDAASCSIYGARAAAGVIIITTKRAKETDLNLNYQFEYGFKIPTSQPDYVSIERYLEMTNELRYNDNPSGGEFQTYSKQQILDWRSNNKTNPNQYPITDWTDLVLKSSANTQTHTFNLSGGSKSVKSKASFVYSKVDGLTKASRYYERFMVRTNNDFKFNKYLRAELDVNFKRSKSHSPIESSFYNMRISSPVYAAKWDDGRIAGGKNGENTFAAMKYGGDGTTWYNKIAGRAVLNLTPIEGLKMSVVLAPVYNFNKSKNFRKAVKYTDADYPTLVAGYLTGYHTTKLSEDRNDNYNVTVQALLNYNKKIKKHNLNLMAGYETYYSFWENLNASRDGYELVNYPYLDLGPQSFRDNGGNAYELAYRSYFGRAIYDYNNRYMFQLNIRHDGSSRFHTNYRWGTFPSISSGWVISEENFMNATSNWLSFLKLRASYGALGNERIGSYYPYQANISFSNVLFYDKHQVVSELSAAQWTYAIKNISWETTYSFDIGLDANFLNNRLRFVGDYYKKTTKDMLIALEIPDYLGFDNPEKNTGKMLTTGYDLDLSWTDTIGDLNYSISANFSDFVSKMGDLGGTEFLGSQVKMNGSEYNEWYGYLTDGLFLSKKDLDASATLNKNVKVGDIKYKDISGPNNVPDGKISPEYDRTLLGGSLPRYVYGANIRLDYKGIDFSMAMQGVGKQNVMMHTPMMQPLRANWGNIPELIDGNYWSVYNTDEENMNVFYPRMTNTNQIGNYTTTSDYYMFNGGYFRLKNITLGYTLPEKLTKKFMIDRIRVYASTSDLFCLSNYPEGWDPEMGASAYPVTKSVLFGISVNF